MLHITAAEAERRRVALVNRLEARAADDPDIYAALCYIEHMHYLEIMLTGGDDYICPADCDGAEEGFEEGLTAAVEELERRLILAAEGDR